MSVKALSWAFSRKTEDPISKLILLALADFADADGNCFPSRKRIAECADCSVDSVDRKLRDLEERGFIKKAPRKAGRGDQTSNLYVLQMEPEAAANSGYPLPQAAATPSCSQRLPPPANSGYHGEPSLEPSKEEVRKTPAKWFPQNLNDSDFRKTWSEWEDHCRESGKPHTTPSRMSQLTECDKQGRARAIEAIRYSISKGAKGYIYWDQPTANHANGTTYKRSTTECARTAGSANAGMSSQYAGIGRLIPPEEQGNG